MIRLQVVRAVVYIPAIVHEHRTATASGSHLTKLRSREGGAG